MAWKPSIHLFPVSNPPSPPRCHCCPYIYDNLFSVFSWILPAKSISLDAINTLELYHVQCFASGFYPLTSDFSVSSPLLRVLWFGNFQCCLIFQGWIYTLYLSPLSVDSWACFQRGALVNRESHVHVTVGCIPLGRNRGHQICISLTLKDNAKQLPKNNHSNWHSL